MSVVLESLKDGVKTIKVNRPERKNAFNSTVYKTITRILNEDASDDQVVVTILTGQGDYFSSGNDLKAALTVDMDIAIKIVLDMVQAFINYPKLIICVVNGTAIGIAATLVALCDIVYASNRAVFDTPFVRLGLCLEGCSSYNFPLILGRSVASEMIFLGRKLTAPEAFQFGLVSKIIPHNELPSFIESLQQYGKLSVKTVIRNKAAIMSNFKEILTQSNKKEFEYLKECFNSSEFMDILTEFLNKKSKL